MTIESLKNYVDNISKLELIDLSKKIYVITDSLCAEYPKYKKWFFTKQLPETLNSNERNILFVRNPKNEKDIIAMACLKKDLDEQKICTLFVSKEYRGIGIGKKLIEESINWLGTTKPFITIADYKDKNTDDTDNSDDDDDSDDVSSSYEFIAPVAQVDVINDYTFYHNTTLDCYHFHTGLDMSGEVGTEVMACLDGTVESITVGDVLDGTKVTLSHANGVKTCYYFIDAAETLKVGDTVSRGDVIGTIAQPAGSEYKDGAHLHFEVYKDGAVADPNDYLDIAEK